MFPRGTSPLSRAFALSVLVGVATFGATPQLLAAPADDFADQNLVELVVVTGTRIKRRDFSSPSPIVTVEREDLEFSGQPTLDDYLNQLPQFLPDFGRTSNNPADGTARLNLRGMGASRTLVLLNGRRLAPTDLGSAVDINTIPGALIDRVEVITGGASTVYGSDAVAGVVNFITRDSFEGLNVEGSYNITEKGDSDIYDVNLAYGFELDGAGNVALYAGYYDREALFAGQRDISSVVLIDDWSTATLQIGGSPYSLGGRVPFPRADLGEGPVIVTWNPDGTPRAVMDPQDLYNFAPFTYLQTPLERYHVGMLGSFAIGDRYEAYLEAGYSNNRANRNLAPVPFGAFVVVNTDNPVFTPPTQDLFETQYQSRPGFADIGFVRRMQEIGTRDSEFERDYTRMVAGIRGDVAPGWNLDTWITWTESDTSEALLNSVSFSRVQQGLLVDPVSGTCFDPSNGCVPVDLFGEGRLSAEGAEFLRIGGLRNDASRRQLGASAVVSGSAMELPTGPLDVALGLEWRRDEGDFEADEQLFSGDALGYSPTAPVRGTEQVTELYAEAVVPLARETGTGRHLDLELGARVSDYRNAGSVWTWKAGLDWGILPSVRLRTMLQRAVRAPDLAELFTEQTTLIDTAVDENLPDPCSASSNPADAGIVERCIAQGLPPDQIGVFEATPAYPVTFTFGGNPDLDSEHSDTLTLGMVWTPIGVPQLMLAVDYYDLEIEDTIGEIDPLLICFDPRNTLGVFCENAQRDGTGNIAEISAQISNRGLLSTEGIDMQLQYDVALPETWSLAGAGAELRVNTLWTHVLTNESQENPATEVRDCAGFFGRPCDESHSGGAFAVSYPEDRALVDLRYLTGPLTLHVAWRWIDGMKNAAPFLAQALGAPQPNLAISSVGSRSYLDLGFGYRFSELEATLLISNLLDEEPPLMADAAPNNTDVRMYDVFGRAYYLRLFWRPGDR